MINYIKEHYSVYTMEKVGVVIPTYNEAENIRPLIEGISKAYPNSEMIIVDDNSPDRTWEVAQKLAKNKRYRIKVIRRMNERGLGSAVIEGFRHANTRIVGVMDADLSHPPEKIPELVAALSDAELAIGSRLVKGGSVEDWPWYRRMISVIATLMARPLTKIKDPMSGFFFLDRKILKGVDLETKGYKILLEILVKGKYQKAVEVPFTFRNREIGKSKISVTEYWRYFKSIVEYMIKNGRKKV
jgi:dolichol-phosphate mannosyltransferase